MSKNILTIEKLEKTFPQTGGDLTIFKDISLLVNQGELVALVGQSGSGKSTILHIAGLLDDMTNGTVTIAGEKTAGLSDKRKTEIRRNTIGFIYQFHHLQPEFSAQENVAMPMIISGIPYSKATQMARGALAELHLDHRLDHRPAKLSGGECQRVAIARAIANNPKLILADEPTGNLDPQTSETVFQLLLTQAREKGIGALIATHNLELARKMDRVLELKDGKLTDIT